MGEGWQEEGGLPFALYFLVVQWEGGAGGLLGE